MTKTEREEARELLELEAKLVRLKIAASHLKQRRIKEQDNRKSDTLMTLLDLGSELNRTRLLYQTAGLAIPRKYRFGALLAAFALKSALK